MGVSVVSVAMGANVCVSDKLNISLTHGPTFERKTI